LGSFRVSNEIVRASSAFVLVHGKSSTSGDGRLGSLGTRSRGRVRQVVGSVTRNTFSGVGGSIVRGAIWYNFNRYARTGALRVEVGSASLTLGVRRVNFTVGSDVDWVDLASFVLEQIISFLTLGTSFEIGENLTV